MDGDPVTGEPSKEPELRKTLAEVFYELFPQYLAIGMTYDEYWHGCPSLARAYRKAWEMKRDQRNWELWLQGAYVYDALLKAAPVLRASFSKGKVEPGKYPDQPYPITERQLRDREDAEKKAAFDRMLNDLNATNDRERKRRAQEMTKEAREDA